MFKETIVKMFFFLSVLSVCFCAWCVLLCEFVARLLSGLHYTCMATRQGILKRRKHLNLQTIYIACCIEGTREYHVQEITGITPYWYAELNVIGFISVIKPFFPTRQLSVINGN